MRWVHAWIVVLAVTAGLWVAVAGGGVSQAATGSPVIGTKVLGRSVDGRKIVAHHLGDPHARTRAVVLGQMHGDEHTGIVVARALLHAHPVRGLELWVIPTMNPDGNAANHRANAHGVDSTDGGHRDPAFRNRLARGLHLPVKPLRCHSTCHGDLTGWVTQHQSGAANTVELGFHPSRHYLRHTAPRAIPSTLGGRR